MKKSRFTDSQILAVLKQAEAGTPVPQLCREHSIRYTERLAEAGVELSVGSKGDSYERETCPRGVMLWPRRSMDSTKRS